MTAPPARTSRSMLFVPAARWPMVVKAAASVADAVCIDLEDSVSGDEKEAARANVIRAFTELDFGRRTRMFRMNALDTRYAYRDVIEIVEAAGDGIDVIMVPKARGPADVAFVSMLLDQIELNKNRSRPIGLEVQIETAGGFLWAREIAQASPRVESLIFGHGDFAASMRMPAGGIGTEDVNDALYPGHRWHAVMHTIVAAARANGLRCMDGPYASFKDPTGFERACRVARALGFDGKQCIHPDQLGIANEVFSPTDTEVAHARRMVDAYEKGVAAGRGAVSLDGTMVDEANVRLARVVLEQAARASSSSP